MGRLKCCCSTHNEALITPLPCETNLGNTMSLGYPVGLVQGSVKQSKMKRSIANNHLLALQCCYVTYGTSYVKSVLTWTSSTLDQILEKSTELYESATGGVYHDNMNETVLADKFIWKGYSMQMVLLDQTVSGVVGSMDPDIKNAYRGLRSFYYKYKAGIFTCRKKCFLIWRDKIAFYVLDVQGRRFDGCVDNKDGYISLLCFETVKNLTYFLVYTSALNPDNPFAISELKIKKLIKQCDVMPAVFEHAENNKWRSLDAHRAILRGSIDVGNTCFKGVHCEMGIAACIMAAIYSRISRPNSWDGRTVDKILLLGFTYLQECAKRNPNDDFSFDTILKEYNFGRHGVQLRIRQTIAQGRLLYTIDYKQNELHQTLSQLFYEGYKFLMISVEYATFIVWRSEGVFYVFDAYKRNSCGNITDKYTGRSCLLMYSTLNLMTQSLIEKLMKLYPKLVFSVHCLCVTVRCKKTCPYNYAATETEDNYSVIMNESIDDIHLPRITCVPPTIKTTPRVQPVRPLKKVVAPAYSEDDTCKEDIEFDSGSAVTLCDGDEPNNIFGIPNEEFNKLKELDISDSQIFAFYNMGMSIEETAQWIEFGLTAEQVALLKEMGTDPEEYGYLVTHGLDFIDVKTLKELMMSPKEYVRYKKLGIKPEDMRKAYICGDLIKRYKQLKLNPEEIEILMNLGIPPEEYVEYFELGLSFEETCYLKSNNIRPDQYAKMKENGMSLADIDRITKAGLTADEYLEMHELGLDLDEMIFAHRMRISGEEFKLLKDLGLTFEQMEEMLNLNISPIDIETLLLAGITLDDIKAAKKHNISPEEMIAWARSGPITLEKILELKAKGVTAEEYYQEYLAREAERKRRVSFSVSGSFNAEELKMLKGLGLNDGQIKVLQNLPITAEEIKSLIGANFTVEQIVEAIRAGMTPKDLLQGKKMGLSFDRMKELNKLKIKPADYQKMLDSGINFDELMEESNRTGIAPGDLLKGKTLGMSTDLIKELLNLGIAPDEYEKMFRMGITTDQIKQEAESIGISPRDLVLGKNLGLTLDEMRELKQIGVEPEVYQRLIAGGYTVEDLKNAVASGVPPDKLLQNLDITSEHISPSNLRKLQQLGFTNKQIRFALNNGITPNEMVELFQFGITIDDFMEMKALGYTLDKIKREASKNGLEPNELVQGKLAGLSLGQMKELKDLGLDPDDTIKALRMGLSPEEVMDLKNSGISLDDYAEMMKQGLTMEQLRQEALESGLTPDEILQGKLGGLNVDQIKELKSLGLDEEETKKAIRAGLTPEVFSELNKYGISVDDYLEMKKAGMDLDTLKEEAGRVGLSLDVYIAAKKAGLNPAQVAELKAMGLSDEDIKGLLKVGLSVHDIKAGLAMGKTPEQMMRENENPMDKLDKKTLDELRKLGFTPDQVEDALRAGLSTDDLKKYKALGLNVEQMKDLHGMNITPEEYEEMLKMGITLEKINKYANQLGLSPKEVASAMRAGISPEDMAELQSLGIKIEDYKKLARSGMTLNKLKDEATAAGLSPSELVAAKMVGVSAGEMKELLNLGISVDDAKKMLYMLITMDQIKKGIADGKTAEQLLQEYRKVYTEKELEDLAKLGFTSDQIEAAIDLGLTASELKRLKRLDIDLEELKDLRRLKIMAGDFAEMKRLGLTLEKIELDAAKYKLTPNQFIQGTLSGLSPEELEILSQLGLSEEMTERLLRAGLTLAEIEKGLRCGKTPEEMLKGREMVYSCQELKTLAKLGYGPDEIKMALRAKVPVADLIKAKELEISLDELIEIRALHISLEDYCCVLKMGLTLDDIIVEANQHGLTAYDIVQVKVTGISIELMKLLKELMIEAKDYIVMEKQGYNLERIKQEAAMLGMTPHLFIEGRKLCLSNDQMAELRDLLIDPESYIFIMKAGFSFDDVKKAIRCGIPIDELVEWAGIGGLTLDKVFHLRDKGITPEAYRKKFMKDGKPTKFSKKADKLCNCVIARTQVRERERHESAKSRQRSSVAPRPSCTDGNKKNLAVVASSSGTPTSLLKLLCTSFRMTDRVLCLTSWGDFVCFKNQDRYYLYSGCSCNLDGIRRLDLSVDHKYLIPYKALDLLVEDLMQKKEVAKYNKEDQPESCKDSTISNRSAMSVDNNRLRAQNQSVRSITSKKFIAASFPGCVDSDSPSLAGSATDEDKVRYAKALIGKKLETINRETQRILNNFRAIKKHL